MERSVTWNDQQEDSQHGRLQGFMMGAASGQPEGQPLLGSHAIASGQ